MAFSFDPGLAISSSLFGAILGEPEYWKLEDIKCLQRVTSEYSVEQRRGGADR